MASNYPFVPDPLQQAIDSQTNLSQTTDQSITPDAGVAFPDFSTPAYGLPASGATSAPQDVSQGADTSTLPFVPQGQTALRPNEDKFPGFYGAPGAPPLRPNEDKFPGFYAPQQVLPQAAKGVPVHPQPNYGNDLAGNILTAEENLPGGDGTQAFIHGAQSQIIPGLAALGTGAAAGALAGSVVPGVGTVVGGIVGGLLGYWIGSQAQDAASKQLVDQQTQDAYALQTQYEQQNYPLQYGLGELAPQFLAFKPNPKAIMSAFRLAGEVKAAPMGEKLAVIRGPQLTADSSMAEKLAYQEHQDALNQLIMMGFGTGYTGYQTQQQIAAGNVQPVILAANLVGSTLLSKPRWIKNVAPELQPAVDASHNDGVQQYAEGLGGDRAKAFQELNDAQQSGNQERIAQAQARWDALQKQDEVAPTPQAQQGPVNFDRFNRTVRGEEPAAPAAPGAPFEDFNRILHGAPRSAGEIPGQHIETPPSSGAWWRHGDEWQRFPPAQATDPALVEGARMLAADVDAGRIQPEEADAQALGQGMPDWLQFSATMVHPQTTAPQVQRIIPEGPRQQARNAGIELRNLTENPAFPRQPKVTPEEHRTALQAAIDKFQLRPQTPRRVGPEATPDELRASIARSQEKTRQNILPQIKPLRNQDTLPAPIEEGNVAQQHAQDVMRQLRQGAMLEDRALNAEGKPVGKDEGYRVGQEIVSRAGMKGTIEKILPPQMGDSVPIYRIKWESGATSTTRANNFQADPNTPLIEDRGPETIKLYHGTTNKALEDIQKYGLRPNNYHRVVNDIEGSLGLDKDSLWNRAHMSTYREGEASIFLAGHPERAAAYAKRFGEAIDEALTAAYHMTHSQHRYVAVGDPAMMKWKAQIADQLGIKPVVAEFEVPLKNIADQNYNGDLDIARQDTPNEVNLRHQGGLPPESLSRSAPATNVSQLLGNREPDAMMQGQRSPADYQQDSINVPAIKHILSEAKSERGVRAGLDPSLIPTLGKNMYSGDIGMVAVKEGLQNALDSLRGVDQAKSIHIQLSDDGFTMSDSGKGMLPAVMQKELVDIGGSTKEAGESGGWGLAKVALFSNAAKIMVRSVAIGKNGAKIDSVLMGSGGDWASGKMQFNSAETLPSTPTGTTMSLEWNPGVRASAYNAHDFLNRALLFNNLPNVRISVDSPHGQINSDHIGLVTDKYNKLSTVSGIGAKMDVYASPTYEESRYGSYRAEVLNNGVYQFTLPIDVQKGIDLPSHLVIDVHATGSPKEDNYPWETNRQALRPQIQEQLKQYVQRNLVADAAKKMEAEIRDALYKAPKFEGSNFRVVDLSGSMEPHVVQAIAASKPLLGFVKQASREFGAFKGGTDKGPEFYGVSLSQNHLGVNIHSSAGGPTRSRNYVLINPFVAYDEVSRGIEIPHASAQNLSSYRGFNLDLYNPRTHMFEFDDSRRSLMKVPDASVPQVESEWLQHVLRNEIGGNGVFDWNPNTDQFEATGSTAKWTLSDAMAYIKAGHGYEVTPNQIRGAANEAFGYGKSLSPQQTDVENESNAVWADLAKRLAGRVSATLIHEYSHEQERNHDEGFSSALTRNIAKYTDDIYSYAKRITRYLTDNNYEGIKEIERLNREYDLSRRMGQNEIFRNVSTGSTAEREPAIDQGSLGNGTEGGQRPVQPLHPSGVREAGQLASGPGVGTGRPEQQIGEQNGIQQETAGIPSEAGQISSAEQASQARIPGEIGQQASGQEGLIAPNTQSASNAAAGSAGGNGNAEAGTVPTSTIGTGIIRPDAGNESGTVTDATGANAGATANESATGNESRNAEANASNAGTGTGNSPTFERSSSNAQQPETGLTRTGPSGRSINASASDPAVVQQIANGLRVKLGIPGYVATPDEINQLRVLNRQAEDMNRVANPKPWPEVDSRLPSAIDKNLLKRTFTAVTQTPAVHGEPARAYAERVVKATKVYPTLDHALGVAKAARDGMYAPIQLPDGKVGFTMEGKTFKDTPINHVGNWDKDFHSVVHSILDTIPNEVLAAEPYTESPINMDVEQLRHSFSDSFQPHVRPPVLLAEERVQPPAMQPHDFMESAHAADTPTSELSSENAANKIKAGLTHVQQNLDLAEQLQNENPFEPVQKEFEKLVGQAGEGGGLPPLPPNGGSNGGGEEPPSGPIKGVSAADRKAAAEQARVAATMQIENKYVDSLKSALLVEDPLQKGIHAGVNDILASLMKMFDVKQSTFLNPRQYPVQASRDANAFAMYFKTLRSDINTRMQQLESLNANAEKRIRDYFSANETARPGLKEQMTADEAALADHLYNYWQLLGDILQRADVINTALEDYFPLIADKNVWTSGERYGKGNVVAHGGKLYVAKNDIARSTSTPAFDSSNWASKPGGERLASKSVHSIARTLDKEDGSILFKSPEELQQWVDEKGLNWKVKTSIGDVFQAQGSSVVKALLMRHAVDQLMNNEFEVNKFGQTAPAVITRAKMNNHPVALDNSENYVNAAKMIGPWRTALQRPKWLGNQRVTEDMMVWKPLAEQMEREANISEMGTNPAMRLARFLTSLNNYFKVFKFALTPMHAYSMLSNVSAHSGWAGTYGAVRRGADITNSPAYRNRYFQLMRASGATEPIGENLGGPHSVLNSLPGVGNFFKFQERLMWKTIGYNALYGLGDKLSEQYIAKWAVEHPNEPPLAQAEADRLAMDAAKKAVGYLDQLDMSKNWNLGANLLLLANRWTTGQLRTMGEAFAIKPLANIGKPIPLEGSSPKITKFMQDRQIQLSRRLVMGGMLRLFLVGTAMTTAFSALMNNGVPSAPWDNYQKDPSHTFDIYAGRDQVTNRDRWIHMPFYLFQREMVDWAMAAMKAQQQGKDFIDVTNLGDSILTAPFVRFAGKMNPVTKTMLEVSTGQEMGQWMKGYSKSGIDSDQYILNLNKSLQGMGIPDYGSLENRLLYAFRNLSPGLNYPTDLTKETSDPWAVAGAIAGLPFGGDKHNELGFLGTRMDLGNTYTMGPGGTEIPTWQNAALQDQKAQLGQQILQIASTMGTGTPEQEQLKLQQMEGLRQQAGFTPGQIVQLILYGAGHNTGGKGLLYDALPPKTPESTQPAATVVNGRTLTPAEEVNYNSVKFQQEAFALSQLMGDPNWKNMDLSQRSTAVNNAKSFVDRLVNEQYSIGLGAKKGNIVTTPQAQQMIVSYSRIAKQAQAMVQGTPGFSLASKTDQAAMLSDRVSSAQTAVWDKYFGTGILKNATDAQVMQYVDVHSTVRDEVRHLVEQLPSYQQGSVTQQQAAVASGLAFADNLVNLSAQGKTMKTFDSPLNRNQLMLAVRNGVVLQDAALRELHRSFIYQEAPTADQGLLDQKYTNIAHNIALYDMREGVSSQPGSAMGFDATLRTTLAADEGYQSLIEQYFGVGGMAVLKQREYDLSDIKTRFRQENAIPPSQLSHYDTLINRWFEQQHPDYASFLHARTFWEKYDPVGIAYQAASQSNLGYEALDPLALS